MIFEDCFQACFKDCLCIIVWLVVDASLVFLARGNLFLALKVCYFGSKWVSTITGFIVLKYLKFSVRLGVILC